jgi:hypothetical protein
MMYWIKSDVKLWLGIWLGIDTQLCAQLGV